MTNPSLHRFRRNCNFDLVLSTERHDITLCDHARGERNGLVLYVTIDTFNFSAIRKFSTKLVAPGTETAACSV